MVHKVDNGVYKGLKLYRSEIVFLHLIDYWRNNLKLCGYSAVQVEKMKSSGTLSYYITFFSNCLIMIRDIAIIIHILLKG